VPPPRRNLADALDPGWLFLIAGLAILSATTLIGGADELARTRLARDRALTLRDLHAERIDRHEAYLAAIESHDPVVIESLVLTQLNAAPAGAHPIPGQTLPVARSASVFPALDPDPVPAPKLEHNGSLLERLATGSRTRLGLIASGGILLLLGLLPRARPS